MPDLKQIYDVVNLATANGGFTADDRKEVQKILMNPSLLRLFGEIAKGILAQDTLLNRDLITEEGRRSAMEVQSRVSGVFYIFDEILELATDPDGE